MNLMTGRLRDITGSYDVGFYVAGFMIAISGVMLFFIPLLQRCTARRLKKKNTDHHMEINNEMAVVGNGNH